MLTVILLVALALHGLLVLMEVFGSHANSHVAAAAHYMVQRPFARYVLGAVLCHRHADSRAHAGIAFARACRSTRAAGIAGMFALVGLFAYEHCFVTAGQSVPLS